MCWAKPWLPALEDLPLETRLSANSAAELPRQPRCHDQHDLPPPTSTSTRVPPPATRHNTARRRHPPPPTHPDQLVRSRPGPLARPDRHHRLPLGHDHPGGAIHRLVLIAETYSQAVGLLQPAGRCLAVAALIESRENDTTISTALAFPLSAITSPSSRQTPAARGVRSFPATHSWIIPWRANTRIPACKCRASNFFDFVQCPDRFPATRPLLAKPT